MKNYIDLGAHFGEGYERMKEKLGIDDSWHVSLFEPNPLCYGPLLSKNIKAHYFNLAVADKHKITGFDLQLCHDGQMYALDGFGSALSGIGSTEKGLGGQNVHTMCVPLGKAIEMGSVNPTELHIKIDIEGAEYSLDYSCFADIPVFLYIEWHSWGHENPTERKAQILASLPKNVIHSDWD